MNITQSSSNRPIPSDAAGLDFGELGVDDPRRPFASAVAIAGTVITQIPPTAFGDPTPCTDYDVCQLTGHLVGVLRRVAVIGRSGDPFSVNTEIDDVADGAWMAAWTDAAHDVQAAWSDPAVLGRDLTLPFATLPGALAIRIYTSEILVHTWDLATAIGVQPMWDDDAIETSLQAMTVALPSDLRGEGIPFDPVVPVADDAPLIDRLVAWTGRRPQG